LERQPVILYGLGNFVSRRSTPSIHIRAIATKVSGLSNQWSNQVLLYG
jgi:hypothetical protein